MIKRTFDVSVSLTGLILLSPLLIVVAVLVKLTSRGPVFYIQQRVGRGFRPFGVIKFRTMVADADRRGGQLTAGADPRITSIGHLLRRLKIDELPQLVNVLKGEMSFVGPRPEVARYVEMFHADYEELLSVRPGITDPASLQFRHESEILGQADDPEATYIQQILPDKIALAKEYLRHASLWLDLRLICRTVFRMAE